MNTKHTPGPWVMKPLATNGQFTVEGPSRNGPDSETNRPWIADTGDSAYIQAQEREANARLIAAAPDLLKAAGQALSDLNWIEGTMKGSNLQSSIILLRAAIEKATSNTK